MKNSIKIICIAIVVLALGLSLSFLLMPSGDAEQARGFRLPPGDMEAGAQAFSDLNCAECHTVEGSDRFSQIPENADLHVVLGGQVHVVKTYGELVTAIITEEGVFAPSEIAAHGATLRSSHSLPKR